MKHVCVLVRTGFLCESYKYRELSFYFSLFFYKITLHAEDTAIARLWPPLQQTEGAASSVRDGFCVFFLSRRRDTASLLFYAVSTSDIH